MSEHLLREYESLFCGPKLGGGMSREVYAHRQDDTLVVKVENMAGFFQNVREWETWQEVKEWQAAAKWLAPCVAISSCGTIMLQRRVQPLRKPELPKQLPAFLTDHKLENFGMLDGQVVCCDYGTNLKISSGLITRLRKANW